MNDLLDEETLAVGADRSITQSGAETHAVRLSNSNALKNHARYALAQQQGQLFGNSILKASSALLSLAVSIKRLQCPEDMFTFRSGIKNSLTDLKYKIAKLDYPPSIADKTCFLFAVLLDEQILHSAWGEESGWENQTLISELFGIKNGGEQFYLVAERALLQPVLLADLLELIYIMLKMGFRGRYRVSGKEQFDLLIQRLEEVVFANPGSADEAEPLGVVSPEQERAVKAYRPKKPTRLWRSVAFFALLIGLAWGGVHYWYDMTSPQKALPFVQLPLFTQQYYGQQSVQEKEYVYRSTPEEMRASRATYGSLSLQPESTLWRVQLATFNTRGNAEAFITEHARLLPDAEVEEWKGQFRVVSGSDSKTAAQRTLEAARGAGISDAFILTGK